MKTGLNFAALKVRQNQHDPETALVRVNIVHRHAASGTITRPLTVASAQDAQFAAALSPEALSAMVRFHHAYRVVVAEAGRFRIAPWLRVDRSNADWSEHRLARDADLEIEYREWAKECRNPAPCRLYVGEGYSVTEAARMVRMRRSVCRDLIIEGLEVFAEVMRMKAVERAAQRERERKAAEIMATA